MSNRENDGSEQSPGDKRVENPKPPTYRRFKKSEKLKGRPKGSKNRKTIVKTVANEMHTVLENGTRKRRSKLELVLLSLRNIALEGRNNRAFDEFHRLIKTYQPQEANDNAGYLVLPAELTTEEFIEKMEKISAEADARHAARSRK